MHDFPAFLSTLRNTEKSKHPMPSKQMGRKTSNMGNAFRMKAAEVAAEEAAFIANQASQAAMLSSSKAVHWSQMCDRMSPAKGERGLKDHLSQDVSTSAAVDRGRKESLVQRATRKTSVAMVSKR